MRVALGPLKWRDPAIFWQSTLSEFFDAIEAVNEMNTDPKKVDAPDEDEMAKLLERYG